MMKNIMREETETKMMSQMIPPWRTRQKICLARRTMATTTHTSLRVLILVEFHDSFVLLKSNNVHVCLVWPGLFFIPRGGRVISDC